MALSHGLKDRGLVLTLLMMFSAFMNFAATFFYLLAIGMSVGAPTRSLRETPTMPTWAAVLFVVLSIGSLIALWGVFKWKWWGVWLFTGLHVIAAVLEVMVSGQTGTILGRIIFPAILVPLALSRRQDFD